MTVVNFASDPAYLWAMHSDASGIRVFDIGANGGMTAAIYSPNFAEVIAFEPAIESFGPLERDAPGNVLAVNCAISDIDGEVTFNLTDSIGLGELTTGDGGIAPTWGPVVAHRTVEAITLDTAMYRYGWPDHVKIDTEGHEARVVLGGSERFWERRPSLYLEMHDMANFEPILAHLQPYYRRLSVWPHPNYGPADPLRAQHFYITAEMGGD
jgi:FkbM family methyltransferase